MISATEAHARIDELADLESDWDSYGSDPPSAVAIAKGHELIDRKPDGIQWVGPVSGGLMMEWAFFNRVSVEVEADGSLSYLLAIQSHKEGDLPDECFERIVEQGMGNRRARYNYEKAKARAKARGADMSRW
jgi:hypothetical protein